MGVDLLIVCASLWGAYLLRFGAASSAYAPLPFVYLLLLVGPLKVTIFRGFRLYRGLWTYAGTPEAIRLLKASTSASGCLAGIFLLLPPPGSVSVTVLVLDWILTTVATASRRFGKRAILQYWTAPAAGADRVLIYGADEYGMLLLRYLRHATDQCRVVGFLDSDHDGLQLRGLPVVRTPEATEANALIVPVAREAEAPERDPARISEEHAGLDLSCYRFEAGVSPFTVVGDGARSP